MRKTIFAVLSAVTLLCSLNSCAFRATDSSQPPASAGESPAAQTAPPAGKDTTSGKPSPSHSAPVDAATAAGGDGMKPDGNGVLYFTVALHLEGWNDGGNRNIYMEHADKLRAYAALFEKYGAKMTLEAKEIIDGCIRWDDNVLLELQQKGHAVGIHADAGGEANATVESITEKLADMKDKLAQLGIDTEFASGVASGADWVTACKNAGIGTVTCMVRYGLWALDPALRPSYFEPYKTPAEGHGPFPEDLRDRVSAWYAEDGSNWTMPKPDGSVLIIPSGLGLANAYEELSEDANAVKSDFTADDIEAWKQALPVALSATDSGTVNSFYAVWSFGQPLDEKLLEEWLVLIDGYVKQGRIEWKNMDEIISIYTAER